MPASLWEQLLRVGGREGQGAMGVGRMAPLGSQPAPGNGAVVTGIIVQTVQITALQGVGLGKWDSTRLQVPTSSSYCNRNYVPHSLSHFLVIPSLIPYLRVICRRGCLQGTQKFMPVFILLLKHSR